MSTISELFSAASIRHEGVVCWGDPVPSTKSGIYVVALSQDPSCNETLRSVAPLDSGAITDWLSLATELRIDNVPNPTPYALAKRLRKYWLVDESILYIGQSERPLFCRIRDLYKHKLGKKSPHRGGHWIRALSILEDLFIHYAESPQPKCAEYRLIKMFATRVSSRSKAQVGSDDYAFPFANLELKCPRRTMRKKHGLYKQVI